MCLLPRKTTSASFILNGNSLLLSRNTANDGLSCTRFFRSEVEVLRISSMDRYRSVKHNLSLSVIWVARFKKVRRLARSGSHSLFKAKSRDQNGAQRSAIFVPETKCLPRQGSKSLPKQVKGKHFGQI